MHSRHTCEVTLTVMLLLFGCGTTASQDENADTAVAHPLCPGCIAGGESTDFNGSGLVCCTEAARNAVSVDDPRALVLESGRYAEFIPANFASTLKWQRGWDSSGVTGYEQETVIELTSTIQRLEVVDQERAAEPSNPLICPNVSCDDYLEFTVNVDIATADGAIRGSGELQARSSEFGVLRAAGDLPLSEFSGTLDLGVDVAQSSAGALTTELLFFQQGIQGMAMPRIRAQETDRYFSPLSAMWPSPNCVGAGVPWDRDEPLSSMQDRTGREIFSDLIARMQPVAIAPAVWLDGSTTQVEVTALPEVEQVCVGTAFNQLIAPLRVRTADGRVDALLSASFPVRWDPIEGLTGGAWTSETGVMDGQSIAQLVPSLSNLGEAEVMLSAAYNSEAGGLTVKANDGTLRVVEHLSWCPSGECKYGIMTGPGSLQ